jgi:hypothetical protein
MEDRELPIVPICLLDPGELMNQALLAGHHSWGGVLAQSDNLVPLESEHPPGECIANATQLPSQSLTHITFKQPCFESRPVLPRLRIRNPGLWRFSLLHTLNGPAKSVTILLDTEDVIQQHLLKFVTLFNIRTRPELRNQVSECFLCSLMPRVQEDVIR